MKSSDTKNKTYFISDLHLDPSRPHLFKLFDEFIEKIRPDAETLYILGDLFEFWIGDDIIDLPIGKPYLPVIEQLRSLSDSGIKLFFIQGNRDFLIGDAFMQRIGGTLLPDHHIIDLYGTKALIMHGDTMCTDDKGYQLMRKIFRLWIVQKIYLSMSPEKRSQKAGQVRKTTSESTKQKSAMILDVNQQAVEETVKSRGVSFLIHGHTHRPAEHDFLIDEKPVKRIVLGDWGEKWSYLEWTAESDYKLKF
ncbi:MAG: UDP-2,3-diacylglucosamine diphosphatase [Cocleimonas sp.]